MKLKNKYIIGIHAMFFEIDIIGEFVDSIKEAVKFADVENPQNITVELLFNMSEYFEKIDTKKITKNKLRKKFEIIANGLENETGIIVLPELYDDNKEAYTIADYRRDLNYNNCNEFNFIIWGESDCLMPRELFNTLETIKEYATDNNIHRFITTFAVRKMWDDSWKILEHSKFTNEPFYELSDPKSMTEPSSIRYTMTAEEMNKINDETTELDIKIIKYPKFDGSGLIISTDLLKNGVNIPHGCLMVGEDTGFMTSCMKMMGKEYIQFIICNILKVHNRTHPQKRNYVLDEPDLGTVHEKRTHSNTWYQDVYDLSKQNLGKLGESQERFATYNDYENKQKEKK